MKTWRILLIVLLCVLGFVPRTGNADHPIGQKAQRLNRNANVSLKYLLYLPKGYENKESWPLVLFLHGSGERGDNIAPVRGIGLPKLVEQGKEFPFIIVSPQCPARQWWEPFGLSVLLDEIVEKYKVDKDRIYATGASMGGCGVWALAAYQPDRLAAIVPIAGSGDAITAEMFPKLPTWVFHGAKDNIVPLEHAEKMVAVMRQYGGHPKLTVYPDAGHDSWTATYNNPELYNWLLQQKRH